ncbi:hypothetical protein CTI14_43715, partial [Methylobacterium radiotolerans]
RRLRTLAMNALDLPKAPHETRVVVAMSGGVDSSSEPLRSRRAHRDGPLKVLETFVRLPAMRGAA